MSSTVLVWTPHATPSSARWAVTVFRRFAAITESATLTEREAAFNRVNDKAIFYRNGVFLFARIREPGGRTRVTNFAQT